MHNIGTKIPNVRAGKDVLLSYYMYTCTICYWRFIRVVQYRVFVVQGLGHRPLSYVRTRFVGVVIILTYYIGFILHVTHHTYVILYSRLFHHKSSCVYLPFMGKKCSDRIFFMSSLHDKWIGNPFIKQNKRYRAYVLYVIHIIPNVFEELSKFCCL